MAGDRAESFLQMIRRAQRGRLKIYIGYAAGVGKTYQMLQEAHRLQADGIDVVVGYVETHGRAETAALLEGLEVLPRRTMTYHGISIEELDLDAILARRPAVVLIDELAHTNVPGSRNSRRYQDVEDLLAAGLHVISTLNVQHLESLYEIVERATGVRVRERIPDRIVSEAAQIVNVDVTTEDLRRRVREGRVYTSERIDLALEHFFRASNLVQLRELTMRELAAQLDARTRTPEAAAASSPDQVMVCLSSRGPNSEALLRYASRLAGRLNRNWYAVYVQTAREHPTMIDAETQRVLSQTLTLAQQLGATVFTYRGEDVVQTILQFAREYRVGHIVMGRPGRSLPWWRRVFGAPSIVERLIDRAQGCTIVVYDPRCMHDRAEEVEDGDMHSTIARPVGKGGRVMIDTDMLAVPEQRILIWDRMMKKEEAMAALLDAALGADAADRPAAWDALMLRESQGETFLGEDVSLPHARLEGLARPIVAIGCASDGVHDTGTRQSARIMILLLSPATPPRVHLAMLAMISRLAQQDQWRRDVLLARTSRAAARVMETAVLRLG